MATTRKSLYLLPAILITIVVTLLANSCATDECYDNRNALPYAGFYGVLDGKMSGVSVDSMSVYGIGAPGDSVLSEGKSAISSLYLPFRIDCDTTVYVFRPVMKTMEMYGIADTVTFIYDREVRFVSSACGASYLYNIRKISYTDYLIDSVVCPGMQITNANNENIKIYFRTGEEGSDIDNE